LFTLINSIFALFVTVGATFVFSLQALLYLLVFRTSEKTAQVAPNNWARTILAATRVKVNVTGLEKLDHDKNYIFMGNHQSQYDIFCVQAYLDWDLRWLAKKELFEIPIFGAALEKGGSIPVDRSNGRKALVSLSDAAKRIKNGCSVIIFPEGTRSADGVLTPFKTGGMVIAIKAKVEVVPIAICGTSDILPKGKFLAKPGRVTLRIGEPIRVEDYTLKQKAELAELLHDKVSVLLAKGVGD
jgi:1-acyl-sn-glycerol-3-phosphate acyltransferase